MDYLLFSESVRTGSGQKSGFHPNLLPFGTNSEILIRDEPGYRRFGEEIIQVYTRFDSFRTYEQFVKWLTQLCASVCEKMDSSLQNYHNQIYTMALGYIRENFETNTLCLNDIARHANISPAYLSSLFKKVSGQSISDTITALRIESACHYLESTSLSLKEISTKCGYTNQYYFSNSFKKKLGMSPSAYREARGTQGQ